MPRRREVSFDPSQFPALYAARQTAVDRRKSPLAALMEAAPHAEPEATVEELLPLREAISDAIEDALTPREHYVFDALFVQRLSLRVLARLMNLSKTHIARIRDEATRKLRDALADNPLVAPHLTEGVGSSHE